MQHLRVDEVNMKNQGVKNGRIFFFSVVGWPSYVSGFVPAPLLTFACRSSDVGGIRRLPERWAVN